MGLQRLMRNMDFNCLFKTCGVSQETHNHNAKDQGFSIPLLFMEMVVLGVVCKDSTLFLTGPLTIL
jgi:hypothetical protein